ncbi:MAG: acyl-CoA dehydrogenase family protein [Myxococcota bacterium]|nr:acyl-CoA dehydrogenase family protein [Myxococcota bacterium]
MDATTTGRADLIAWLSAQPTDLFADDADFSALVTHYGLDAHRPLLHATGQTVAGPLDELVRINNRPHNGPSLAVWDGVGRYTADIEHHPTWRRAGELIYGTGIMALYGSEPPPHQLILSLFYLTGQAGEAGHNCPLACNAGAIRTLSALGTQQQQERYLAPLLDPDFSTNFTASQFLTEVQGGSDVGANATIAAQQDDGTWRITGEKWFCSNADADVFLMTARVSEQGRGTRGLGLFVVPRRLPDGSLNAFAIRRLKDKLGTRTMASGEIDFTAAYAENLGPTDGAFQNIMRLVINTSRLYNAFGCAAHARRAWVIASTYAAHRRAFGQPIAGFADVCETLSWMRADAAACLASSLWLARLAERDEAHDLSADEQAFFRIAVNLNKTATATLAHDAVNRGIEILGGNGAIESFSILPRLLRDNVVYENWEGTHNVLRAQVLRDCLRLGLHEGFFSVLTARLGGAVVAPERAAFVALSTAEPALMTLRFRRLAHRMSILVMLAAMSEVPALAPHAALTARHLGALPVDAAYLALIEALRR